MHKNGECTVEAILYFNKAVNLKEPLGSITLIQPTSAISPLKKAIASACGDMLLFTSLDNIIVDIENTMLQQASNTQYASVAAPFTTNTVENLIGIRKLQKIPYLVVEKRFASINADKLLQPRDIVLEADRKLSLVRLVPVACKFPDYLIGKLFFIRPYHTIIRRRWQLLIQSVKAKHRARIAEKLRRQIPPVVYSPDIPVFIICRDRVEPLKELVEWCEKEGLNNIILIDNNSTYPPLLKYYSQTKHEVIRLNANIGHTAPWDAGIIDIYAKNKPFIVTDPDVIPAPESHGAIRLFCQLLNDHPERTKAGFGLKIDDLPDSYDLKDMVIAWESPFWVTLVEENVYDAEIDTTFALYRQNTPYTLGPGLRTGGSFVARHEAWYVDSRHVSPELKYYREHANKDVSTWGVGISDVSQTYVSHKLTSRDVSSK